ncbi:primary-amine oxidase [Marinobacterium sp. YM272]|uniref:primary-amine oxidase n=1 Tax=Marinobacterium sp. YM272 TaxID=3421654 RepID=UPI003D7FDBAA
MNVCCSSESFKPETTPGVVATHPLDPLSVEELELATTLLTEQKSLSNACRFPYLQLAEPPKAEVLAHEPGKAFSRKAFALVLDKDSGEMAEAIVDLVDQEVVEWTPLDPADSGQAPIMMEEFFTCVEIVQKDPQWRAAVKRRGLTDEDIEKIQIDPWSFGYFGDDPKYKGRRLMRGVAFYRDEMVDNGYAHPIEGLVAIIDLNEERVIELLDDGRDTPIPKTKRNYDTPSLGEPREGLKPLHIVQPEGVSFQVDGWKVSWQNWEFRVGFTPREGLVLNQLSYNDKGKTRPIIYRASVSDMAVPYSDTALNHYWKCAFDGSEYGLGRLANQLELGCDCLGAIRYFDIPAVDDKGESFLMKNAVCMHEEDYGTLWKHYEFRTGVFEVRRSRRLVISFFCTVGNYDYGFYWYLYQDGTIQLETKLTGIIQTAGLIPGTRPECGGGLVTPEIYGPTHQHFFNARLHMMLDGEQNSVMETNFSPLETGDANPWGSAFKTEATLLKTEQQAARQANGQTGRFWKIINPNVKNAVGNPTGYKLVAEHNPAILAQPDSYIGRRAGFARNHVWVTPYDPDELYGTGKYTNQHPGDGLPKYVEQNRSVENTDIVLWHTYGHTHICKPEDFPVMPVEYVGFTLKPNNFFNANPAMDLPGSKDSGSVNAHEDQQGASSCCS